MYSLVSAPVLGFDLVRLPGGHRTAVVLADALCLTEPDLELLAVLDNDDPARDRAWWEVLAATATNRASSRSHLHSEWARRAFEVRPESPLSDSSPPESPLSDSSAPDSALASSAPDSALASSTPDSALASAAAALATQPLGTVDGLLHVIRHDVLDWTWRRTGDVSVQSDTGNAATAVLCDAAVSGYVPLTPDAARRLGAPWLAFRRRWIAQPLQLGPQDAAIRRGLEVVRHLGLDRRAALLRAVDSQRDLNVRMGDVGAWSRAVHEASWAVHLSGRVRDAAWVQFAAVQAVADSGLTAPDCAEGAWNAISGALQTAMVADLLPADLMDTLLWPWERAFGPLV
ncbi:MAG: hypothetical protein ACTHMZ_02700 [Actinomycetes bacterium]